MPKEDVKTFRFEDKSDHKTVRSFFAYFQIIDAPESFIVLSIQKKS